MIKTNIEILDDCVDGEVEKLTYLVGQGHNSFRKFCEIYRDLFEKNMKVDCNIEEEYTAFSIQCSNDNLTDDVLDQVNHTSSMVDIIKTETGVTVNISLNIK